MEVRLVGGGEAGLVVRLRMGCASRKNVVRRGRGLTVSNRISLIEKIIAE
jgi:hypothetical protein